MFSTSSIKSDIYSLYLRNIQILRHSAGLLKTLFAILKAAWLKNVMKGVTHCGYVMIPEFFVSQWDCGSRCFDRYTAGLH